MFVSSIHPSNPDLLSDPLVVFFSGIGESEWAFKSHFYMTEDELKSPNIDLVFDGLDTFASVHVVRHSFLEIEYD